MIEALVVLGLVALFIGPLTAIYVVTTERYNALLQKFSELTNTIGSIEEKVKNDDLKVQCQLQGLEENLISLSAWEQKLKDVDNPLNNFLNKVSL